MKKSTNVMRVHPIFSDYVNLVMKQNKLTRTSDATQLIYTKKCLNNNKRKYDEIFKV
jgi:hypothetical protein